MAEEELLLCLDTWVKAFFPEYTVVAKDPKRHKKHLPKIERYWISHEPGSKDKVLIESPDSLSLLTESQILKDYEEALARLKDDIDLKRIRSDNKNLDKQKKCIQEELPAVWQNWSAAKYLICDPSDLDPDPLGVGCSWEDVSLPELEKVRPFPDEEAESWVNQAFAQADNAGHSVIRDYLAYCMVGYIHQTRDTSQTLIPRTANQVKNIVERMRKKAKLRFPPARSTST